MAVLVEFSGDVPILIEAADVPVASGVRPSGIDTGSVHQKAANTLKEGLRMIGAIGDAVRGSLVEAKVDEAEVKIGLKVSGTGQFVVAQSTVEGAIEVTFKVRVAN
ncbi:MULTISPECIES: CU044_2847 family protein [Sinorhizobium]|uniref:CU044_2847 family protein n=1 Tax=Sinorhizobium TaxID=28105 RepID=UPI000483945C|nr:MULTISPECIES: CU044_2847 family protein [Sinorhizobium]WOS67030.1 CU044_2847 family protein [Sinorhizobium fredii GR64]